MRIIAGEAKGRRLVAPDGDATRPMQDRIREALFSSLAAHIPGADILDLYAGTGSMGLEALSRGAASATFVERAKPALQALHRNCAAVGLGGVVVAQDVQRYLKATDHRFDVVFVDPPYPEEDDVVKEVLALVSSVLVPGGLVVLHRRVGSEAIVTESLGLVDERRYGGAQLWRYEKETE